MSDGKDAVERWYRVSEAEQITGFGRTSLYGFMNAGKLRSVKVLGARRIPESALAEFQKSFDGSGEKAV